MPSTLKRSLPAALGLGLALLAATASAQSVDPVAAVEGTLTWGVDSGTTAIDWTTQYADAKLGPVMDAVEDQVDNTVDVGAAAGEQAEYASEEQQERNAEAVFEARQAVLEARARAGRIVDRVQDWAPIEAVDGLARDVASGAEEATRQLGLRPSEAGADTTAIDSEADIVPVVQAVEPVAPLQQGLVAATVAGAAAVALWLAAGTSSSVGAAGASAATGAKAAASDLRRLLPFASPLFTRFERDTVLGHPRREALYAIILQNPGVSLQSLGDATGLSRTATLHHLRLMEKQHLIVSRRMGRSRHFFENGGRFGRDQKAAYAVLQNDRSRQVAQFVDAHPGSHQKDVCEALGLAPSIAHWHVRRLQEAQLLECRRDGRNVAYLPGPGLAEVLRTAASPIAASVQAPVEAAPEPVLAPVILPQAA